MENGLREGCTLVELVVALAIGAILLGIGIPSFSSAIANSRRGVAYDGFVGNLYLARSESVKAARIVTVCARATDTACGDDWNRGALVYIDRPPIATGSLAVIGDEDRRVAVGAPIADALDARLEGSVSGDRSGKRDLSWISYRGDGGSNMGAATLSVCDDRGASHSRAMNIVLTGDLRRARPAKGGGVPLDAFGSAICPRDAGTR